MKKYKVIIASAKDVKLLNDKIATDSLFTVGETITSNPLHVGVNVVTDKRIIDSVKELAHKRGYCTPKNYLSVDDEFAVINMQYVVSMLVLDAASISKWSLKNYQNAINGIWTWRRSGLNYSYYILDTDNNKVLDY